MKTWLNDTIAVMKEVVMLAGVLMFLGFLGAAAFAPILFVAKWIF